MFIPTGEYCCVEMTVECLGRNYIIWGWNNPSLSFLPSFQIYVLKAFLQLMVIMSVA